MGRFCVIAPQFTSFKTFIAACITLVVALAAPGVLQGQCQPLARAHDAQAPEPRNASPSKPKAGEPATAAPEFYDEPKFTVAGVTDATNLGGHGSAAVQRNTETLTNEAILLKKESPAGSQLPSFDARAEKSLRASLEHDPGNAELHHSLADAEEKLGNPLEAVREYQHAAELDPTEPNLFDWGAELLLHHAPEPAIEVLAKGNRLFPHSARMLIALGVGWQALGTYDRALRCLFDASDLNPRDPIPYLFLGKMQNAEIVHSAGFLEKMERFSRLQPENPLANYYYAVALWKRANGGADTPTSAQIESLLNKAIHLNPKLDVAYLQLGILYGAGGNFPKAIAAYQKASDVSPELEEPHYRLAQSYRRIGEKTKAQHELQLYSQLSKKNTERSERERHEIQQFVFALRDQSPATPQQQPEHQ
jgi:tetratricopeptide (TPR) repeat protein